MWEYWNEGGEEERRARGREGSKRLKERGGGGEGDAQSGRGAGVAGEIGMGILGTASHALLSQSLSP